MKNLSEVKTQLKKEMIEKLIREKLKIKAIKKTGINEVISYSDKSLAFFWSGNEATKEDIKKILKAFPPSQNENDNYMMSFASYEKNFKTDSNIIVSWENYENISFSGFKICYTSKEGIKITINVASNFYGKHVYKNKKQGKHLGFGRYQTINRYFIDYFYTQSYSGGYNKMYFLEGAESLTEYANFVFTGEFKYDDEI